jgi:hypothetical protein
MRDFTGLKQHKSVQNGPVKFANTVRYKYFCQVLNWRTNFETPFPNLETNNNTNIMASKKYSFLLGLIVLVCSSSAIAQDNVWSDSSYYQSSKLPQYNEFMNNLYSFPPKPRNMWEVGLKVGSPTIMGDVPAIFPTFGFGAHVRKALGYTLSLRLEYFNGTSTGQSWQAATNYMKNPAWVTNGYVGTSIDASGDRLPAQDQVYYNFKTKINDLSLQTIINFSNIKFHVAKTKVNFYALAGIGVSWYEVKVDALNGTAKYNFNSINSGTYETRKDVRSALKDLQDGDYETLGESSESTQMQMFGKDARFNATAGLGIAWRLSRRLNIAFEDRMIFMKDDPLDGQRWTEQPAGDASVTRNFDALNYMSLGLNINIF